MKDLLVIAFFCSTFCHAQEWEWASRFDFAGNENNSCIGGTDKDGNLYVTVSSSSDYQLLKLDLHGNLAWNKKINEYPYGSVATDLNGNSYLCSGNKIVKFDNAGNKLYEASLQTSKMFTEISILQNDKLLIKGVESGGDSIRTFVEAYDINAQLISSHGTKIPWVLSAKGIGAFYFAETGLGSSQIGYSTNMYKYLENGATAFKILIPHSATTILTDKKGNVYLYGWHVIYPITINNTTYSTPGHYLLKYDPEGNLIWYKIIEGSLGNNSIALDAEDNLYYTISYSDEIKINELQFKASPGALLVAKFDPTGTLKWHSLTVSSNTGEYGYTYPGQIYVSADGGVFVSSSLIGSLRFGQTVLKTGDDLYPQLFVGKLDQSNTVGIRAQTATVPFDVDIYPNPSAEIFNITGDLKENSNICLKVTDAQGRIVYECWAKNIQGLFSRQIDLGHQSRGIYFLEVYCGDHRTFRKLVCN